MKASGLFLSDAAHGPLEAEQDARRPRLAEVADGLDSRGQLMEVTGRGPGAQEGQEQNLSGHLPEQQQGRGGEV